MSGLIADELPAALRPADAGDDRDRGTVMNVPAGDERLAEIRAHRAHALATRDRTPLVRIAFEDVPYLLQRIERLEGAARILQVVAPAYYGTPGTREYVIPEWVPRPISLALAIDGLAAVLDGGDGQDEEQTQ